MKCGFSRVFILLALVFSIISIAACSSQKEQQIETKEDKSQVEAQVDNKNQQRQEGLHLELIGVSQEFEKIFQEHFYIVEQFHNNLIYRQSDDIKRRSDVFVRDRPDLKDAKMIYDAEANELHFGYYYELNPNDIDIYSNPNIIFIDIVSYNYILRSIDSYLNRVIEDVRKLNVRMDYPKTIVWYYVNEDNYLITYLPTSTKMIFGVKIPGKKYTEVEGSFASGTLVGGIGHPKKDLSGTSTDEQAVIDFFYQGGPDQSRATITTSINNSSSKYTNLNYGFSLSLPEDWVGRYTVEEKEIILDWTSDKASIVSFDFELSGKLYYVFSIVILESEEYIDKYSDHPFWRYIDANKKWTYVYEIPGEPATELFDEKNKDELEKLIKVVNEDVPEIIKSFTFE